MATKLDVSGYGSHLQAKFVTKQECYAVGDSPFSVPASVEVTELSALINKLLSREESEDAVAVDFDFLINGEFLRVALGKHLEEKSISTESVVEIEYLEKHPAPQPAGSILHDDWVSSVQAANHRLVTGSYDNAVRIWTQEGENLAVMQYHSDPVKTVAWIQTDDSESLLVSGSMDQTLLIWKWNEKTQKHECLHSCRGHAGSVESVAVDQSHTKMASGSMDSMLKVWSAVPGDEDEEIDAHHKKAKTETHKPRTRTPLRTFDGHTQGISSVVWVDEGSVCTASWDHTMCLWDIEQGEQVSTLTGNKVFLSVSYSQHCKLLATGSTDRHIRLWDPRQKDGVLVKSSLTHHHGWVSSVDWSPDNENLLISGSYDKTLKLWDTRSPRAPLYNMSGCEDKILAVDWSKSELLLCGGADNALHIFKSREALQAVEG
ncbi:ribosome biogenesis protein WDR12-like isoform X1 [Acanthaster planci]|uniref:Ribosome biogenesis protein WDR12 homolog n=1 Tax=Acanthaster planci TaxID=133434 RepID=A0A8B7Z9G1_ACAPL|nr:ribosome biogenesis protein WDR12-like isoform X1 [Acanthaster planci]